MLADALPKLAAMDINALLSLPKYYLQSTSRFVLLGAILRSYYLAFERANAPTASAEQMHALRKRFFALLRRDVQNVERGFYPRELLFQPFWSRCLRQMPQMLQDAPRRWWRKRQGRYQDLPNDIDRDRYPAYYLRNFHWQTDGWLSERSAELYDPSVELLFGGTADVMRRMAIAPMLNAVKTLQKPRILDIGCGTGRFLAQLQQALPHAELVGVDLSEPYLHKAKKLLGDNVQLDWGSAEALPYPSASFDGVTSVFVFHELPRAVRRQVLKEAHRVLRPGGCLVLCDSAQQKDGAEIDSFLGRFDQQYHEPYFRDFLKDALEVVMAETGFEVLGSESHFVSKVVWASPKN